MPYPGSIDTLTFAVEPHDNTTHVTLVVNGPNGAQLAPVPVSTDGGATWQANPTYSAVGEWVPTWTVTGTGAGIWARPEVWVSAIPSPSAGVAWRPELWHVAAYIPRRTLVGAVDGYGNALETFDSTTHPSASAVNNLVSDACAWVGLLVNPVPDVLADSARAAAAMRAAAMVELTYPDNRDDLSTAEQLLARADAMRADLDTASVAVTGTDPEDPAANLLPVYSFPTPVAWGDALL